MEIMRYLLLFYLRYISPIFVYIAKKRYGNIKPVVCAEFMHSFIKTNWKELKRDMLRNE